MNSSQKAAGALEDVKIPVKLKLSALWAAALFLYAYGDIFGFFRPDVIESVKAGKIAGFQINQGFLLAVSIYILIPSAMVFLTLVLKPEVNRWANLIVSVAYFATIVLSRYRRDLGLLHISEPCRICAHIRDRLARIEVASPAGQHPVTILTQSRCPSIL